MSSSSNSDSTPIPIPVGAWDSHMHVTDLMLFPLPSTSDSKPGSEPAMKPEYTLHPAPLSSALINSVRLSLPNLVLIQPSPYGYDNSCLLHHLRVLNGNNLNNKDRNDSTGGVNHARGVVAIDIQNPPDVETMQEWHKQGVRGVRLNLKSVSRNIGRRELMGEVLEYLKILKVIGERIEEGQGGGWVLQLYCEMRMLPWLKDTLDFYSHPLIMGKTRVVVDHLGCPNPQQLSRLSELGHQKRVEEMQEMEGYTALLDLLEHHPEFYVKISAPYRYQLSPENCYRDPGLKTLVKELLTIGSGRKVVFASDWPHTRFHGVDVRTEEFLQRCLEWCGEVAIEAAAYGEEGVEKGTERRRGDLVRGNAERLWGFDQGGGRVVE